MSKTRRELGSVFVAFALLALVGAGCGGVEDDEPEVEEEVLPDGKADVYNGLAGTYRANNAPGKLSVLVLTANKKYHSEENLPCMSPGHCATRTSDGSYKLSRRRTKLFVTLAPFLFYDKVVKYEYKVNLADLSLRKVGTNDWFTLTRSQPAWCNEVFDCESQNIVVPMCLGRFKCEENTCRWSCNVSDVAGEPGATCGGIAGLPCRANLFCDFPRGSNCGIADQPGVCAVKSDTCRAPAIEVCGCDGKTWAGECEANRAGVSVRADGPCPNG